MTEPVEAAVPEAAAPADLSTGFAAGDVAAATVYLIHGKYVEVEDLDGSMVEIEKAYPTDKVSLEIAGGERGNVLVAAGEVISEEAAAKIAAR
jgi:hypothetical protein